MLTLIITLLNMLENLHQGQHCASFLALGYVCKKKKINKKNCYSTSGSQEENAWELTSSNCIHSCEFFSSGCCKHCFTSFHSSFSAKEMVTTPWCHFSSLTGFNFSPIFRQVTKLLVIRRIKSRARKVLKASIRHSLKYRQICCAKL